MWEGEAFRNIAVLQVVVQLGDYDLDALLGAIVASTQFYLPAP